jgi:hypothetical protein
MRKNPSEYLYVGQRSGPFEIKNFTDAGVLITEASGNHVLARFYFNPSYVVPVGNENAPRTLSVRYWRRTA